MDEDQIRRLTELDQLIERIDLCLHAEGNVVQAGRRLIVQEAEEKEFVRGKRRRLRIGTRIPVFA